MKWYLFDQNNSGGSFVVNDLLCHRLFIEASSKEEACNKAEGFGVYFDGYGDCPCCGNRWSSPTELEFPIDCRKSVWGIVFLTVEEYAQFLANEYGWTDPDARIFHANTVDGKLLEIWRKKS